MDLHKLRIKEMSPLEVEGEGFIHPTTCSKIPNGEWIDNLRSKLDEKTLDTLRKKQPLRIGNVHVSDGRNLPFDKVVHMPLQTAPGAPTTSDNIQVALRSGLVRIDQSPVRQLVIPKLLPDTGIEDMNVEQTVETVITDIVQYPPQYIHSITFASLNDQWNETLQLAIENNK